MSLDAVGINALAEELDADLSGCKIEKVTMPDKDNVVLHLKTRGNKALRTLLLSAAPSAPRVHLTKSTFENPLTAHAFLMHLRKHIGGGVITRICSVKHERVLKIFIDACDEMGYKRSFTLFIELLGRFSNVILTDENGLITDAIRRVTIDTFSARAVVSGMKYALPPSQKDKLDVDDKAAVIEAISAFSGGKLADYLLSKIYGFSPASLREIVYLFFGTLIPAESDVKRLSTPFYESLLSFCRTIAPCCLYLDGKIKDYFFRPYTHLDGDYKQLTSLSEAMEEFYSAKEENGFISERYSRLATVLKNSIRKNERTIAFLREKLTQSQDYENDRILGELLTANLYRLKKGDLKIDVDDYYSGKKRVIILDATLSPQQNAQRYYKAYSKKRRAIEHSKQQLTIALERGDYLESVLAMLEKASTAADVSEIETEMVNAGLIKHSKGRRNVKPAAPLSLTVGGFRVLIGKNNLQNDKLVRTSEGGWLWLHTQKIHGSHAVIQTTDVPQEVINEVAAYVAYFSKASLSANVPVDYTLIKHVKKPSGAPPGKVIYSHQQTVNVTPKKP